MSRTVKGSKGCGYEYWSARPFNKCGGALGAFTKKRTHKAERRQGKEEIKRGAVAEVYPTRTISG